MTKLLNEDGTASMATALMMSHHAFRRDLARFAAVLVDAKALTARADAVRAEWTQFHGALHGHHHSEDTGMFPGLRAEHAHLGEVIDRLGADHRKIDPLLERGDRVFAHLPAVEDARVLIAELTELLDAHLATEEAHLVPFLRGAKEFPPPPDDNMAKLYADGFAWSSFGIASDVLDQVAVMVPKSIAERLPAARAAFAKRWERTWGDVRASASHTSIPGEPAS